MLTSSFPQGYLLNAVKSVKTANLTYVSGLSKNYLSYCISLNSKTGTLNYLQVLQGDVTEPNFIQALTATKDSLTMIGGNLNSVLLDGLNGFLLFKGTPASTPPCTTNYWLGTINYNWETAGNWSCGIIPGPESNVIINGGTPVLNSNVTISTLTINTGVIFTVNPGFNLIVLH